MSLLIAFADTCSLHCNLAPSQQPPPRGKVQNSSAISVSWSPPDSPNAHWLTYSLFRDGFEIYTIEDQYPYSEFQGLVMERYNILKTDTLVKFFDIEETCCCLAWSVSAERELQVSVVIRETQWKWDAYYLLRRECLSKPQKWKQITLSRINEDMEKLELT